MWRREAGDMNDMERHVPRRHSSHRTVEVHGRRGVDPRTLVRRCLVSLEGPVRFVTVLFLLLLSSLCSTICILPREGYPFPGLLRYDPPGVTCLFLGMVWVIALIRHGIVPPPALPESLLEFPFLVYAAGSLFNALIPSGGWSRAVFLLLVGLSCIGSAMQDDRELFLRRTASMFFLLLLFKFVIFPGLSGGWGGGWFWKIVTPSGVDGMVRSVRGGYADVIYFMALFALAAAVLLQWRGYMLHLRRRYATEAAFQRRVGGAADGEEAALVAEVSVSRGTLEKAPPPRADDTGGNAPVHVEGVGGADDGE